MRAKFNNEQTKEIIDMYNSGMSEIKIAKKLGEIDSTIHRLLVKNKIKTRKQRGVKIPNSEIAKILKRIENGERQYKIAEDYGVGAPALSLLLKRRRLFVTRAEIDSATNLIKQSRDS